MLHLGRKQLCTNLDPLRELHSPAYHKNALFGEKTTLHYFRPFEGAPQSCIASKCCIWRENNFALFKTLCGCFTVLHTTEMQHLGRKPLCTIFDSASATQSCIAPKCCISRENNFALFKTLCECYRVLQRTEMLHLGRKQLCTNVDPLRVLHSPA